MQTFLILGNDTDRTGSKIGVGTRTRCEVASRAISSHLKNHPQTAKVIILLAAGKGGRWKGKETMARAMGHLMEELLGERYKHCTVIINDSIDSVWGSYYELLWAFNTLRYQSSNQEKGKAQEKSSVLVVTNEVHASRVEFIKNHFFPTEPELSFVYSDEVPPSWLHERLAYLKLVAHMIGLGPIVESFRRKYFMG